MLKQQIRGVVTINYGSNLREMRKRAGMSQEDVALELHMSISNVSRLETGKYELKAVDLARWAEVTNAMDMLVAMFIGVDLTIVQQVLETIGGTISTILLGGIL